MQRTAERPPRSPAHSPSTPSPIGVTAPIPVITTRRGSDTGHLHRAPDTREGARSDPMDEHGTDDPVSGNASNQRPPGPAPVVHDRHVGLSIHRLDPPDHVHAGRDAPNVTIVYLRRSPVHPHLGHPPGGIAEPTERPPCRHLHQAAFTLALQHPHPAIVAEQGRPFFDLHGRLEHPRERGAHPDPVDGAHQTPAGRQVATRRRPGRRSTRASTPAAARRARSSPVVYPRRIEVIPSAMVNGSNPSARAPHQKAVGPSRLRRRSATITPRRASRSQLRSTRTAEGRARWCTSWLTSTRSTDRSRIGAAPAQATAVGRPAPRASRAATRLRSSPIGTRRTPR